MKLTKLFLRNLVYTSNILNYIHPEMKLYSFDKMKLSFLKKVAGKFKILH